MNGVIKDKKTSSVDTHSRYFILLIMIYLTLDLSSNAVGYRLTSFGPFIIPGSTFIYPFTYTLSDIITEIYGFHNMRKIIWAGIFCDFLFSICVLGVMQMPHPTSWPHDAEYSTVFGNLLRFNFACTIAIIIGSFSNSFMISKWGAIVKGRYFWLRSLGSCAVGQAVYLILALSISFCGLVTISELIKMISYHYVFNLVYTLIAVIPATICVSLLKKHEPIVSPLKFEFTPKNLLRS